MKPVKYRLEYRGKHSCWTSFYNWSRLENLFDSLRKYERLRIELDNGQAVWVRSRGK